MKSSGNFKIIFKGKDYELDLDKTLYVLSKFENKEVFFESEEQINALFAKYDLFDEWFLKNLNQVKIAK